MLRIVVADLSKHPYARESRNNLRQETEVLCELLGTRIDGEPGNVCAGPRRIGDQPETHGIERGDHYDRNRRRGALCGNGEWVTAGDYDFHARSHHSGCELLQAILRSITVVRFDNDIAAVDVAKLAQALGEFFVNASLCLIVPLAA